MAAVIAQTERLILRQLEVDNLDDIYRIYHSGENYRFIEPMDEDRDVERAKLESYIFYMYGFYGFGLYAVCLKDSGKMIGRCGVWMTELDGEPEMEIGYVIEADSQGYGYALESIKAVVAFASEETDVDRLIAKVHKSNIPSARLAVKAGFVLDEKLSNDEMDIYTYTLIRFDE